MAGKAKGEVPGPAAEGPPGDPRIDRETGAVLGDPNGYRFATGRKNVDTSGIAGEMLRNRHASDD